MKTMIRPITVTALSVFLLTPSACTWSFGNQESETTEMHRRLSRTVDIQTGVVLGDLDRAQSAAAWLATYQESEPFTPASDPYRAEIRGYASLIAQASDMESVSRRVGQMAAACGSCHEAYDAGPRFVLGSEAPTTHSPAADMIRHLWAADRMWEGLIGPSEEAWNAGADALNRSWANNGTLVQASSSPDATSGYLATVRTLGQAAHQARTQDARAAIYGELLNTCNGCHSSAGVMVER